MARIRSIKPEFWIDEKVVDLGMATRLLFIGLWSFADDQGYIDDKPRRIKMQVFPGDEIDVEPLLDELVTAGLLVRYDSPIGPVLHIRNWDKHQKVDRAASPRFDPSSLVFRASLATPREPSRPTTPSDEVVPASVDAEGKGSGSGRDLDLDLDLEGIVHVATAVATFDHFWAAYPRREAKDAARRAWAKAVKRADPSSIIAGAERYRDDPNRDPTFTAHASTWLNAGRWADDALPARASPNGVRDHNGLRLSDRTIENLEREKRLTAIDEQRAIGGVP